MRRTLVIVVVLALLLLGAWTGLDASLTNRVRDRIAASDLGDVLEFRAVSVAGTDAIHLLDVSLRDPATGAVVGFSEGVDLGISVSWEDHLHVQVHRVLIDDVRLTLRRDERGIGLVRAIDALIDGFTDPDDPVKMPDYVLTDLEILCAAPDVDLHRIPECSFTIVDAGDGVRLNLLLGKDEGHATAWINEEGLKSLELKGVELSPTLAALPPEFGEALVAELHPSGRLDLEMTRKDDGGFRASGLLLDGTIVAGRIPFPLEGLTLPFVVEDDHLRVEEAELPFEDGAMTVSIDRTVDEMHVRMDVVDATFRSRLMALVPPAQRVDWLRVEDGGTFDLHVEVDHVGAADEFHVRGSGGFLIERFFLGKREIPVEHLVGSFTIDGDSLRLHDVTGASAGGLVGGRATIGLADDTLNLAGWVWDMDVARLSERLVGEPTELSGWLQGEVTMSGILGNPYSFEGEGQASIRGGNLWSLKVLTRLLNALLLDRPDEVERHRLEGVFNIRESRINFPTDGLYLDSDFLSLRGDGRIGLDGELRFRVKLLDVPMGPIGKFFEFLQRQIVDVSIGGTVGDPVVTVTPVKIVTGPLKGLWDILTWPFRSNDE